MNSSVRIQVHLVYCSGVCLFSATPVSAFSVARRTRINMSLSPFTGRKPTARRRPEKGAGLPPKMQPPCGDGSKERLAAWTPGTGAQGTSSRRAKSKRDGYSMRSRHTPEHLRQGRTMAKKGRASKSCDARPGRAEFVASLVCILLQ